MDSVTKSFKINLRVLRALGLYPPATPPRLYKLQGYCLYSIFTLPIIVLGALYLILEEDFDMAQLDYNVILTAQMICQVAKLIPFINKSNRIRRCIHYFEAPMFAVLKENQKKIIDSCVEICRRNSIFFIGAVVLCNIFLAVKSFLGKQVTLPVDVWLPDNLRKSKFFYLIYLVVTMGVGYTSIAGATIDPLMAGLAGLAAGHLEVLKDNLQHLSEYAEEDLKASAEKYSKSEIIGRRIKRCIEIHNEILRFVNEYEECFSVAIFGQILGSILVICFCCLQLSTVQPFTFSFYSIISFLSCFLLEIYLYCYYGTILFEETNTLTNAIYMGAWYEYDVKSRKDLIIIMECSKKPITLVAGKILDLSVATFTLILRRSYSLLAVLKNR